MRKKLLSVATLTTLLVLRLVAFDTVIDYFNRTNGALGSAWVCPVGEIQVSSNKAVAITDTTNSICYYDAGATWANDQSTSVVVTDNTVYVGSGVRIQSDGNGYFSAATASTILLFSRESGTFNFVDGVSATVANGDVIRIGVVGTAIKVYQNDVEKISATRTAFSSGRGGLQLYRSISGARQDQVDDFTATGVTPVSSGSGAASYTPLPSSFYSDLANTGVPIVTAPCGDWYLPSSNPVRVTRSNVRVNWDCATIYIAPTDNLSGWYPIKAESTSVTSPTYTPSPTGSGPGTRTIAHATGLITNGTTSLTMVSGEFVNYTVGEQVLIWAGVANTDPVESEAFIPAVVASVNMTSGVVTFTQPLGKNITNYGTSAALQTAVLDNSLDWKVGPWGNYPDPGNFSKGYGTDHGIERFVGGMVHDVYFHNLHVIQDELTASSVPNSLWTVSATAVQNFTMDGLIIENPVASGVHLWRAFGALVKDYTVSGKGIGKIFNTSIFEATAVTAWGGDGLTIRNLNISGTDIAGFNVEVGAENIWVDGMTTSVTFTNIRDYSSSPTMFGFHSVRNRVRVSNANIGVSTSGGSQHEYFAGPILMGGDTIIADNPPTSTFDWQYLHDVSFDGTLTLNGIKYGPTITETRDYTILHGASHRYVTLPEFYSYIGVEILTMGQITAVSDTMGGYYGAIALNTPRELTDNLWYQVQAGGTHITDYQNKQVDFELGGGSTDAVVRFTWTRMPIYVEPVLSAVAFDSASKGTLQFTPFDSYDFTHTVGDVQDRYLALFCFGETGGEGGQINFARYNDVDMTFISKVLLPGDRWVYAYGLTAPAVGTHTIKVYHVAYQPDAILCLAASYSGILQTGQPEVHNEVTLSNAVHAGFSLPITPTTGGSMIVGVQRLVGTAGTGTTIRITDSAGMSILDSNGGVTGASSLSQIYSGTYANAGIVLALAPSSTGTGPVTPTTDVKRHLMMGVGD